MTASRKRELLANTESVHQLSAAEQAYQWIRLEILTFGMEPGSAVSEMSLSKMCGLPIAAIRAAVPRLRQDGLLINLNRRGQMVSPVTLENIEQTYEMRFLLEPAAAEKSVNRIDLKKLKKLDIKARAPTQSGVNKRASEVNSMLANRDFHVAIADSSGNQQLAKCLRDVHDRVMRFQYLLRHSEAGGLPWKNSHEDIIAAFEQTDTKMVNKAIREHIRKGRELTVNAVLSLPEFKQLHLTGESAG